MYKTERSKQKKKENRLIFEYKIPHSKIGITRAFLQKKVVSNVQDLIKAE